MVIEQLKARAGLGGAKLEIRVPGGRFRRDETLQGEVILTGGRTAQEIAELSIRLIRKWYWEGYSLGWDMDYEPGTGRGPYSTDRISVQAEYELDGDRGSDEVLNIVLGKELKIALGDKLKFPFEMSFSGIQGEKGVNEKWKLQARAIIPFARDALSERSIELIEAKKST